MILITAFEPFDETGLNSSLETLCTWQRQTSHSVRTAILPVRYEADVETLDEVLADGEPATILHLGQTTRGHIEIERMAVNLKLLSFETSADGPLQHAPILPHAPAAYEATIPIEPIVRAMVSRDLPARDSAHAGTYLCNHIMFRSLHRAATQGLATRVGFIHLPRLPAQAQLMNEDIPTLPLDVLVESLGIAVDRLLKVG
jgi:pyroglutamyl-peptidase